MEKQNIIDGIRLIVIIGVFIFMVIGSYRNIINQNKVISTNTYIDKDNEIVNSNLEKEEVTDIENKYYEDISKEDINEYILVHFFFLYRDVELNMEHLFLIH